MRIPNTLLAVFAAALLTCTIVFAAEEVTIESGRLRGVTVDGVTSFKGIPFVAPPTGANRWRAPQPAPAWTGVREATSYCADCMQVPFPGDAAPLPVKPSEDCLYLNVWSPAAQTQKAPVIVWIYGGGFVNGGSSPAEYDGTSFAKGGLVFVSFNYRVGRFGFFAYPALTKEDPGAPLGNYAFMDQIAALRWVQRNIASFGGDPANVTIFGESAGGYSVLTLLTSPAARGLFHKAMVESGGGRALLGPTRHITESKPGSPSAEEIGVAFAKKAGIEGTDKAALTALRQLPAEKVLDGLNMMTMNSPTYSGPMIDGKVVVETCEEALKGGRQAKVPFLAGANSGEFGFSMARTMEELFAPFGANKERAEAIYNPQSSTDIRPIAFLMGSDRMFVEPCRFTVRTMRSAGQPAYEYRFSYVAESSRSQLKSAPHASEIPFVFNTVATRYRDKVTPADLETAKLANAYWVAFAKTGNPNGPGRPEWPVYDPARDVLLNFKLTGPVAEPDPWKERLDLIEAAFGGGK